MLSTLLRSPVLHLDPCIPSGWSGFEITFLYRGSRNEISVENPRGVSRGISSLELNGIRLAPGSASLPLVDDGATRRVRLVLG